MAIVIAAALLAIGLVVAALLYARAPRGGQAGPGAPAPAPPPLARDEVEAELLERRGEIVRIEERAISKEEAIDAKLAEYSRRDQRLDDRERELEHQRDLLEQRKREHLRELERVAGLSASQAKQVLLKEVEDQARHDAAKVLRQIDEETKLQAERRVRNILSVCMGRLAATHASETTVSVVQLPSDDMKGRVIGREGRNIRALENLTGVDFIIDDTPHAVVLSGFDGVRREVA
ncbi:MAG: ribonucrease, partial [Solirubrobacteraceae bacterium]|nr:ribonucrease [Solirubrobacteraceae bacterium]